MTSLYHPRPERWPQVSFKGFFVLVTVLCVFLGWVGVQLKWIHDRHAAISWMEQQQIPWYSFKGSRYPPANAPLSIRVLGEPGLSTIEIVQTERRGSARLGAINARAEELRAIFPEANVRV